ncbi:MAG: DUF4886 domain-containing protein, partial [Erysipelotrichaceae bacterium]|nr:DUF4886 domain-containing protein [Erysipelotrichaceae bacterium]
TDARRINPYTQGRSNLAMMDIPAFSKTGTYIDDSGRLDIKAYDYLLEKGCITQATNQWVQNAVNLSYQIPLTGLKDYDSVTITANQDNKAFVAFFTKKMIASGVASYASGWETQLILEPGQSETLIIPEDAQYLYIIATNAAGNSLVPESVVLNKVEQMTIRYDDHLDMTGKTVQIIDAGTPTSYQVGYGVEENTVMDSAVVTLKDNTLVATGIGTAKVSVDNVVYDITVETAPISLILLAGQSNMQGIDGDANQSIVCPDGMVYSTYAHRYKIDIPDVSDYVPSALTGEYREINVNGETELLSDYPVYGLTALGDGREGPDSGFAYEWVQQTGEKIWVVNMGYGGSSINTWIGNGSNYQDSLAVLGACQDTLQKEIAAGHYTLSHMGYYWLQGCADETQTAAWYVEKYLTMHESLKNDFSFDHDMNPATAERTFEFGGIIPIRSGHQGAGSYRAGAYTQSTSASYFTSFYDLRMNGPRVAQYWMGNNPELTDIYNVCTIQEQWATLPDGTDGVKAYFSAHYENGKVDYTPQVAQKASWYTPSTPTDVHDNIHYNQIGYNEIGRESVRNTMIYLGINEPDTTTASVQFVSWDGFTPVTQVPSSPVGSSSTLAVPMVSPVYLSKEVTYTVSDGLSYDYYDVLAGSVFTEGTLTSSAKTSVSVESRSLTGFRWSFDGTKLTADTSYGDTENLLTKFAGSLSSGLFNGHRYQTSVPVILKSDESWVVEWTMKANSSATGMIFSTNSLAKSGQPYVYVRGSNSFVGIGYYDGTNYYHVGYYMSDFNIDMNETHVYRFVNYVENGSNMVYLFVDGEEIGPMNQQYQGSTTLLGESEWVADQDFVISYFGTSDFVMSGLLIEDIAIKETGAEGVHFHHYSQWEEVSLPDKNKPGVYERVCESCNDVQQKYVDGVWQTLDFENHLSELPEEYCAGTNLWLTSEHDEYYLIDKGTWGIHSSNQVYSVTIPVTEGDHVYATSFGKAGQNGHASSSGIRMTWLNDYGVVKTLTPQETYAQFSENGYLVVPEDVTYINIPMWNNSDDNEVYILNAEHDYEAGVCQSCGTKDPEYAEQMTIRYDDHLDMTGKTVQIIDAGTPTSYQVGYGVEENTVLDSAVVTLVDNALIATGIGSAKVSVDDVVYDITVETAPISLILLIGQSNMRGSEGDADQSIVCPDGMVYATFGDDRGDTEGIMNAKNATKFAASALTGQYSTINVEGTTEHLSYYPLNSLTEDGKGTIGPDSGFAYEWVKQTGEKVWIVNAAHGGTSITTWVENATNFKEADLLFSACQETLRKEIAAGHFSLSHMGYYWCQGCSDAGWTAEKYATTYLSMHESLKKNLTFDDDSNPATPDAELEFAGIIPVRAGNASSICYREGTYEVTTTAKYHESFKDLRMTGPRVAQYWMTNNPELEDIWLVCNISEDWVTMPDGTNGVSSYFQKHYANGTVDYTPQVAQKTSWYTPTTPAAVHDSIHYNQIGYNEIGRESVRNTMVYLGINEPEETETTVEFVSWDGFSTISEMKAYKNPASGSLVVPMVSPVYKSKEVTYALSEGLSYAYYDLLTESVLTTGALTASNGKTLSIKEKALSSYHWNLVDDDFASTTIYGDTENPLTLKSGSIENGTFSSVYYLLEDSVVLKHDKQWVIEWEIDGSKTNASGATLLSAAASTKDQEAYLYVRPNNSFVGVGYNNGTNGINFGYSLLDYGYDVIDKHTYRLVNRVEDDGSNMIYLFVDGKEVGPLNREHKGSTQYIGESNWVSGQDFVFSYLGSSDYPVNGMTLTYLVVSENDTDETVHFHNYTEWTELTAPSKEGPAVHTRTCDGCGNTETREVDGVWQKFALADHLNEMPEYYCSETNLWDVLEHDPKYFTNGTTWTTYSSGNTYKVPSITIPIEEGAMVFATSFGKAGENGHATSNGIRMTWFDDYGVIKTMGTSETYKEFAANGGYLVAPEGAKYINIPMWETESSDNEVYILNREHQYTEWTRIPDPLNEDELIEYRKCNACNLEETREIVYTDKELYDAFVAYMNKKAQQLGMVNTTFVDPAGIGNFTTAEDIFKLMLHAQNYEGLTDYWGKSSYTVALGGPKARNKTVQATYFKYDLDDYYEILGGKTGTLAPYNARNLAIYLAIPDSTDKLLVVMLSAVGTDGNAQDRYKTVRAIADYVLSGSNEEFDATCKSAIAARVKADGSYEILYQKNTLEKLVPASISKVMTALCALDLLEDKTAVLTYKQSDIDRIGTYYTNDFYVDDTISFEEAIPALILPSSNITAAMIGRSAGTELLKDCAKVGHKYTSVVTEPTCAEDGYTTYTCVRCDDSYVEDVVDATLKHTFVNGVCTVCGSNVADDSAYTHAVPENVGVKNAIERAYLLTDVEWTPLADVPGVQKINGEFQVVPFEAGKTYKGIPYSGVTANDCYVGLNVSLESFLTALENENSVLYTENLFSTNPKSATYYGTVCSKFAQYVLDVPGSYNTNNVANIPGMETIAMPGKYTVDQIKLGDVVLNTSDHTTVVTDILYDAQGNVAYVEISEAVLPLVRRKYWNVEEFYEHFATYRLCRYQYLNEVPEADEIDLDDEYALMPRNGDKYNYTVNKTKAVVDVLESGYQKAVVVRDGTIIDTIELNGANKFSFDRSVPGHIEMYLVKEDGTRSSSVYANVVSSSVSVLDSSEFVYGKLKVQFNGSSGTPLYVQVGSAHAIFCNVEGQQGEVEIQFAASKISSRQVRVAYQNEYGIYLSSWVPFSADENPSTDPLLSQGQYWNGYNITPSSPTPVIQEGKEGYWSYTMVPVESNTTYYSEGATRMWYLDENGNKLSTINVYKDCEVPFKFTTPAKAAYVSVAYSKSLIEQGTETLKKWSDYSGKVISIYGDSISTFAGYIPVADGFNLEHLARYPQDNLLTDVNETWWMQVISSLDSVLGINDSWRGATVSGAKPVTTGTTGENASFANLTRVQNLGSNGTPDIILFYGGTNDLAHVDKIGTFDVSTAPSQVQLTTKKWDNLADGYVHTLLRLKYYYPNAVILAMLPTVTENYYYNTKLMEANAVLKQICDHYDIPYVDLTECGLTVDMLPDGIHPDAEGMDHITDAVLKALMKTDVEAGKHTVYTVQHQLNNVIASKGHYKGTDADKSFTETLDSEHDMNVTVTMGNVDITDTAVSNGVIFIEKVTGNLVITAEAQFTLGDHLKELPEEVCSGINLWNVLEHDQEYYSVDGWAIHPSNKVTSVTFAVEAGMKITASSFGAANTHGGTVNGIRVTYFNKNGLLKTMSVDEVYAEFSTNGALTVPDGATHISIPMWTDSAEWEIRIVSAEHDYESVVTAPTCNEEGYTTYTCSICKDSYIDDVVEATQDHSFNQWHVIVEPTYEKAGEESRECTKCSHVEFRSVSLEVISTGNFGYGTTPTNKVIYTLYSDGTMVVEGTGRLFGNTWRGDDQPFYEVRNQIKTLIIGEGITQTTGGCFAYLINLEKVSFPSTLTHLNKNAFMGSFVSGVTEITIPETVTYLADYSFGNYMSSGTYFTDIIIENPNVTFKASNAVFNSGYKLNQLTLYSYGSENNVRTYAEEYGIRYVDLNDYISGEINGLHYEYSNGELVLTPVSDTAVIPTVNQPWSEFKDDVTKIVISSGITEIPANAFVDYTALMEVEVPIDLKSVGNKAFAVSENNNAELKMTLPRRMTSVGQDIFEGRTNVQILTYYGSAAAEIDEPGVQLTVKKVFNLLLIGNSYSEDASNGTHTTGSQLFDILKSMLGEDAEITVGLLASGGKGMHWHATQAYYGNASGSLKLISTSNPTWKSQGSMTSAKALSMIDWDAVSLQPYNVNVSTGQESVPYPDTTDEMFYSFEVASEYMLDHVKKHAPQADVYLYMHWAQTKSMTLNAALSSYNKMANYFPVVLDFEGTETGAKFETIIPVGQAVQNARSTYLALLSYNTSAYDDKNLNLTTDAQIGLQRDPGHLSFNIGRYLAALTFAEMVIPEDMRVEGYTIPDIRVTESVGKLPKEYTTLVQMAVNNAISSWKQGSLAVTPIEGYETDPAVEAEKTLSLMNIETCGNDESAKISQITEVVKNTLHEDFVIEEVTLNSDSTKATVTIRYGYTTVTAEMTITGVEHTYGEWECVSEPSKDALGVDQRICTGCDDVQTREVEGSWQKFNLADHLQMLPEMMCEGTNLWDVLEPEEYMLDQYGQWIIYSSKTVYSITIPVEPGDKIYANSFGITGSSKGIQVSFIDNYGLLKTTFSSQTYKEFTNNGGYLVAPEGAVAVNIPVWNVNHENNEVRILEKPHNNGTLVVEATCTDKGYTKDGCLTCDLGTIISESEALGHEIVIEKGYDATCLTPGLTDGSYCDRCDERFAEQERIEPGHKTVLDSLILPTVNSTGLTSGIHCEACGEVLVKQDTVDAVTELSDYLRGMKVSILGDSISTYLGVSNNEDGNTHTVNNVAGYRDGGYYKNDDVTSVDLTWWMQTINDFDMELLVNHASGSGTMLVKVSNGTLPAYYDEKAANLHDNTGNNAGMKPDIIAVYIGVNDASRNHAAGSLEAIEFDQLIAGNAQEGYSYAAPATYAEGYAILLHKLSVHYPDAEVFLFTLPSTKELAPAYREVIIDLADYYGSYVVDLYDSEMTGNSTYFFDGVHPNKKGMSVIADQFKQALLELALKHHENDHNYESVVTAPTCKEEGYTTYTCSICTDSYVDDVIGVTQNHTYVDGICSVCGHVYSVIPSGWTAVPLSRTENSTHLAYQIVDGVLTFCDFGDASDEDYGIFAGYTNNNNATSFEIPEWYKNNEGIKKVVFDESISFIGSFVLTNMNSIEEIHIENENAEVSVNMILFSTTNREEALSLYAASTLKTVDTWIRGHNNRKISKAVSSVTMYYINYESQLKELEDILMNSESVSVEDLNRAYSLLNNIPDHKYNLSDYQVKIEGSETLQRLLSELTSGSCGNNVTYQMNGMEGNQLHLVLSGSGDVTSSPWQPLMESISDVTISDLITGLDDCALPEDAVYHVYLNSEAYDYAQEHGLDVELEALRVLSIGNSHTNNYSTYLTTILKDLQAAGLETKVTFAKSVTGSIGLYSGRNSNVNATYRSHLEGLNSQASAYNSLKNNRYDLIVVQDYMESIADAPEVFAEGLSSFIKKVREIVTENGNGNPEIAWFADWVDIRTTGGDNSLYDGQGNKIKLESLTREEVYAKSLANVAHIEEAIRQNKADMPDFVIHASTIKQNAMSSYLGTSTLYENTKYSLIESDNTHLTSELGCYLMGAGVVSEIMTHYQSVLKFSSAVFKTADVLTLANTPKSTGSNSQTMGSFNAEILDIVRESISSPNQFKQSVYINDPAHLFAQQFAEITWSFEGLTTQEEILAAVESQIPQAMKDMVDSYTIELVDYESENDFTIKVQITSGYTMLDKEATYHKCDYQSDVTAPTCTEQGYTTHTCSCGDSYVDSYVDALGHKYDAIVTIPSGTTQGYTTYQCSQCNDNYRTETIDESWFEGKTLVAIGDSITAGVKVTKGETDYSTLIGKELGMTVVNRGASGTTFATGGPVSSSFSKLNNLPTDTDIVTIALGINDFSHAVKDGYYQGKLKYESDMNCYELGTVNSTDTTTIYGALHMWANKIVELKETETYEDVQFYFITPLITSWNVSISSKRDWNQSKENIHGIKVRDICNAIIEIAEMYDIQVIDLNITSGLYYNSETDNTIDKFGGDGVHPGETGHQMMADAIIKHFKQEFLSEDHEHTYGSWIMTTYPTCTDKGEEMRVCVQCTKTESREVDELSHQYESAVTAPTCEDAGYTTYTCSRGDHSYVSDHVEALGHEEVTDEAVEATCTETGLTEGKHCERCGEVLVAQTVTDKLGHNYTTVVTAPTCEATGYTTYTCTRGDHTYVGDHTNALGHEAVIDAAVDATCTETGLTEGKHCERCGEVLVEQTVTDKLGHNYESVI